MKWFVILYYHKNLYQRHTQLLEIHRTVQGVHKICMYTWIKRMYFVLKLQAILYALNGFMLLILPPIIYVLYGEKQLYFAMRLPFYDFGFWPLILYETVFSVMGAFGTFILDYAFVGTAFNAAAYISLVKLDFEIITMEILKKNKSGGDFSSVTKLIRASIVRHQAMQK